MLLLLLILFLNPLQFWMPDNFLMLLILLLLLVFAVFASFLWREAASDEREHVHRARAGRVGFLIGAGLLVVGIAVQAWQHTVDVWLVITLGGMILGKISSLIYSKYNY